LRTAKLGDVRTLEFGEGWSLKDVKTEREEKGLEIHEKKRTV